MPARVLAAGLDARELVLEVRFLQREPAQVREAPSFRALVDALAKEEARLVVIGTRLADLPLPEAARAIRTHAPRRLSILALAAANDPPEIEAETLRAGANAALRRPLDRYVLESWVAKLLDVPRRIRARVPVHVQVVGTPRASGGAHFYALTRNLSAHGMLLASPVQLESGDVDLELGMPAPDGRVKALGRVVRRAPEVSWPYLGYGIEFLFLPPSGERAIERLVEGVPGDEPARAMWGPGTIHSTLRRDPWIYELGEPARMGEACLVEIRRALREEWRPGRAFPFYVVEGPTPPAALDAARAFVREHG